MTLGVSISPWIAVPAAAATLAVVGAHLAVLRDAPIPPSRKRIRTVNGWLMLLLTPTLAYATSVAEPAAGQGRQRVFVFAWLVVLGLLALVVMLALVDAVNSVRLHRRGRRAPMQAPGGGSAQGGSHGHDGRAES